MNKDITVLITAAGSGTRSGLSYNKMLLEIAGKPLVYHSAMRFVKNERVAKICLIISEADKEAMEQVLNTELTNYRQTIEFIIGGSTRQGSVYNGLQSVDTKYVIVHDGARPFISNEIIDNVIESVEKYATAIVGTKVTDTIKHVTNNKIDNTIDREPLWAVQTPQATLTSELKKAHNEAVKDGYVGTDESSLLEKYSNLPIHIVAGSNKNIKITTKEDVQMANFLYEQFNKEKVKQMWKDFCKLNDIDENTSYEAWHFCDNEKDADELAKLVLEGVKTGTTSNNIYYMQGERKPQVGDYSVVLNYKGEPKCVIKTMEVKTLKFSEVTDKMAYNEGEGDKSLQYWRNVHKQVFEKEMKSMNMQFSEDMLVVYETFKMVYK